MKTRRRRQEEGSKKNRRQEQFLRVREGRNQGPRGCFYRRSAPRPRLPHRRSMGKRATVARSLVR